MKWYPEHGKRMLMWKHIGYKRDLAVESVRDGFSYKEVGKAIGVDWRQVLSWCRQRNVTMTDAARARSRHDRDETKRCVVRAPTARDLP